MAGSLYVCSGSVGVLLSFSVTATVSCSMVAGPLVSPLITVNHASNKLAAMLSELGKLHGWLGIAVAMNMKNAYGIKALKSRI